MKSIFVIPQFSLVVSNFNQLIFQSDLHTLVSVNSKFCQSYSVEGLVYF